MQDTIIKGTGDSRSLKCPPNLLATYPTWEAAAQALQNGTFPVDIGNLNPLGLLQTGTGYTKADVLPADLQAAMGLPDIATPADAYKYLYRSIYGSDTKLTPVPTMPPCARTQSGSYVGTGTSGASNPNRLTFQFEPKLLVIVGIHNYPTSTTQRSFAVISKGGNGLGVSDSTFDDNNISGRIKYVFSSVNGKKISWYSINSSSQQNDQTLTYFYTAIG